MRYKTKRGFLAACPNRYSATIEPYGARTLFFIYYIVPAGCGERDALVRGNLMTATARGKAVRSRRDCAEREGQDRSSLEVVLQDV